jgi:hypothetical protein
MVRAPDAEKESGGGQCELASLRYCPASLPALDHGGKPQHRQRQLSARQCARARVKQSVGRRCLHHRGKCADPHFH